MNRRDFIAGAGVGVVVGAGVTAAVLSKGGKDAPKMAEKPAPAPPAAPAVTKSRTELVVVSTWPRDFPGLGTSAQRVCKRIEELTEGRLHVTYYAAGERVGAFASFDEVASGNAQAYIAADYYWKGKHPGWAYFTAIPFGHTYTEIDAWIKYGGGQQLWDELADSFGLKCWAVGNTGVQMGGWFNKEINSAADLKGLKMRIPGLGGDVLAKLGASPVSLPGGQIYENLVSGAIDATEWVGPWNDYFLKFYEAAKYYYYPGMHEPGSQLSFGMNKSWLSKVSKTDQALLEAACNEENARQMAETNNNNGIYLTKLIKEHGVKLKEFNDETYDAFGKAAKEVRDEVRQHSPLAAKIDDSFGASLREVGSWSGLSDAAYVIKRNRVLGL
jgi:TRAP-type mannitol/chloroaromatic compound transport system substrate-binding protein